MICKPGEGAGGVGQLPAHHGPGMAFFPGCSDMPHGPNQAGYGEGPRHGTKELRAQTGGQLDSGANVIGRCGAGFEQSQEQSTAATANVYLSPGLKQGVRGELQPLAFMPAGGR
jgi:hypothetical protein